MDLDIDWGGNIRYNRDTKMLVAQCKTMLIKEIDSMYTQEITVKNEVGLHARPATYFIQKANEFKSGIWVEKEERRVGTES